MKHFDIPLDLPHAGTVSRRIARHLDRHAESGLAIVRARELAALLEPFRAAGENPPRAAAEETRHEAARIARELVGHIEALSLRDDRLGQLVRNVFECLALGEEGAALALRAGEDPASPMRP